MKTLSNKLFILVAFLFLAGNIFAQTPNPVHAGRISYGAGGNQLLNAQSVFVSGNYAYVASYGSNALVIIDISNPATPVRVGSIADGDGGATLNSAYSVFVSGNYAYVSCINVGTVEIVDVSNPASPVHAGSVGYGAGLARSIYVSGNLLYVASFNSLKIFDVTDPSSITQVGSLVNGSGGAVMPSASSVYVSGNYAYVLNESPGNSLEIVDVSIPSLPVHIGSIADGGGTAPYLYNAFSLQVSGNYAYICSSSTFEVVDVSTPSSPTHAGSLPASSPISVYISGNHAYVASYGSSALYVIDISTPSSPSVSSVISDGGGDTPFLNQPYGVFVSGNYAYVASRGSNAMEVLNISNPSSPAHAGSIKDNGALLLSPESVSVSGNYAYVVSSGSNSFEVVDITTPSAPTHVAGLIDGVNGVALKTPISVVVSGNYAYVASSASGAVEIIDVSNPSQPTHSTNIYDSGEGAPYLKNITSVFVSNNYLYALSDWYSALEIFDVTDPTSPVHKGYLLNGVGGAQLAGPASVYVVGSYAYVATSNALEIVDVSNPSLPVHAGSIVDGGGSAPFLNGANSVFVSGNYAFIASSGSNALEIVDVSNPLLPVHAGSISNGGQVLLNSPVSVSISGNFAYVVSNGANSLEIVNVSDPTNPSHVYGIYSGDTGAWLGSPTCIFVSGNYDYITSSSDNTLEIISNSFPAPTITGFTPSSGPEETSVTITGTNFDPTPANNIVQFNGVNATVTASTSTSITTTVPSGASTGLITVSVNGQTATSASSFTVQSCPTLAVLSGTSTICSGNSTNLIVSIVGGTSPYSVTFTDGATPVTINNYVSGDPIPVSPSTTSTYSLVSVSDATSCASSSLSGTAVVTVNVLTANVSQNNVTCFGNNDGSINVAVTQGSGPYQYSFDGGATFSASSLASNLAAGVYNVYVQDLTYSCTVLVGAVVITQPFQLSAAYASSDVSCNGANDGTIIINSSVGGSGLYEYSISGGSVWQSSGSFTGLSPGTYNVMIRDASSTSCVVDLDGAGNTTIVQPGVLGATVTSTDVSCNGAADGNITISSPVGGSSTYEYSIDGGVTWQASGSFSKLSPATFNVMIRDAANTSCIIDLDGSTNTTISQPAALGVPTSAAATGITANSFQANWSVVVGVANYYLDVASDAGFTLILPGYNHMSVSTTSQLVSGLAPATTYYYRAVAANGSCTSSFSNTISVVTTASAAGQWSSVNNGLFGGQIVSLATSGSNIFAGTADGFYVSIDNGVNWKQSNGLANQNVKSIVANGGNIFAGTLAGVFLSTDNGGSWTAVNNGLTNQFVYSLVISGSNILAGTTDGVFQSADNGTNWSATTGLSGITVSSFAVSGSNIFAGTNYNGVRLSTDNGATWTASLGVNGYLISSVVVSGTDVFAATENGGVFLSTNNGVSWTGANNGLTSPYVYSLGISGSNILAGTGKGIFLSADNGASWSNSLTEQYVLSFATGGTNVFAGTNGGGVVMSNDNGATWTATNTGLSYQNVYSLATSGNNVFAGTLGGGVFLTTNNGTSWTAVNNGQTGPNVYSLAVTGSNIFAGTNTWGGLNVPGNGPSFSTNVDGVFLSANNGTSWTEVDGGLSGQFITSLGNSGTNIFAGTNGGGAYLSTNNGASWTAINSGLTNLGVYAFAFSGSNFFAGTYGHGVYLSTDNGTTWSSAGLAGEQVISLVINGGNLFAGTNGDGIFLSTDNGATWNAVNNGLADFSINSLVISGSNIFAGTYSGVFLSTDNGTSWSAVNNGLTNQAVQALTVNSTNIFAGTTTGAWSSPLSAFAAAPPVITSFLPTSGTVGTSVAITGTNFDPTPANNIVQFNGTTATVTASTATVISATVPAGSTSGPVSVTVGALTGVSASSFTVIPTITTFSPTLGAVGAMVVITGTGFDPNPSNNIVKFNGVAATIQSSTATSITVTVPVGATTGLIKVNVNGQIVYSAINFSVIQYVSAADSLALVAIYNSTNGPGWTNSTNWLTGPVATWYGITVLNNRVDQINLTNNLVGTLPPEIGNLTAIRFFRMYSNSLSGSLPTEITNLTSLKTLGLAHNNLSGTIPAGLWNIKTLGNIFISYNQFTGTIPSAIGNLTALFQLILEHNQFSGVLPPEIGTLPLLTGVYLGHNQFTGSIPSTFGNLYFQYLGLDNNNLSGSVPSSFSSADSLYYLNLGHNKLTSLPDLSSLPKLKDSLYVNYNNLQFGDLEPNINIPNFAYIPQDTVDVLESVLKQLASTQTFTASLTGTANLYQWKKSGTDISGATNSSLTLSNITFKDDATYGYSATNSIVKGLTLVSQKKILRVSSIQRDSIALTALYNATNGSNWTNNTNWTTTPLSANNWFGVIIVNNRVTGLSLPSNNLTGVVPKVFGDAENLTTVDLSGNKIKSMPDLTTLDNLTSFNVSSNNLDFASLLSNVGLAGASISYANQGNLGAPLDTLVTYGTDFTLKISTKGKGNVYQWTRNGSAVSGATDTTYLLSKINRGNMGTYVCEVTNPGVPNLKLTTYNQRALAVATISGSFVEADNTPVGKGNLYLFKVNSTGAYDTTQVKGLVTDGTFSLSKVVLDDYVLLGKPDTTAFPTVLPTYYKSTIFWEQADTVQLQGNRTGIDILAVTKPTPDKGTGEITGTLDDVATTSGGRVEAGRRVSGAGVSASRGESSGKVEAGKYTLVAYTLTDQNGVFLLSHLSAGNYRLDIQYPGFPMDTTSFITFTIGTTPSTKQVIVAAAVDGGKIVVKLLKITGVEEDHRFSIYPNPTKLAFNIDLNETMEGAHYAIIDMLGEKVKSGNLISDVINSIDVSALRAGLYIVEILQGDKSIKSFRIEIKE